MSVTEIYYRTGYIKACIGSGFVIPAYVGCSSTPSATYLQHILVFQIGFMYHMVVQLDTVSVYFILIFQGDGYMPVQFFIPVIHKVHSVVLNKTVQ